MMSFSRIQSYMGAIDYEKRKLDHILAIVQKREPQIFSYPFYRQHLEKTWRQYATKEEQVRYDYHLAKLKTLWEQYMKEWNEEEYNVNR